MSPELERATGISPDQFIGKSPRNLPLKDYDWRSLEASCREAIAERKRSIKRLIIEAEIIGRASSRNLDLTAQSNR
jgi:hypothetical protein